MKVYITSCGSGAGAWTTHEQKLKKLYTLSDKRHSLVDDPTSADVILVGNVREENWGEGILKHELINKFPNKCFSLSDQDRPLILNRGIYASATKSRYALSLGRVRSGSYTLYGDHALNPYVQRHDPAQHNSSEKKYLLTFIGRDSHRVRTRILALPPERADVHIEDSSKFFDLWGGGGAPKEDERQKYYCGMLVRSKFSLCPRGCGASSVRVFEAMRLGVAPVILSDEWVRPKGPNWKDCAIFIKEKDVRQVVRIVESHASAWREMGALARKAHEDFFAEDAYFNYIVGACADIGRKQFLPEALFWRLNPALISFLKLRAGLKGMVSRVRGKQ